MTSSLSLLELWPCALAAGGAGIVALTALSALALAYRGRARRAWQLRRHDADLIENIPTGIYRSSADGRQLSANKALVELNGYATEAEMLAGVRDIGGEWYVDPARRQEFRDLLRRDGKVVDFVSEVRRHRTGERIWISESARCVVDPDTGRTRFYEGTVREITETVRRLKLEEHFQKLTRALPGALFEFALHADDSHSVLYISEGMERLTGHPYADLLADPQLFDRCILEEDLDAYYASLVVSRRTLEPWEHELRITTPAGQEKWLRISGQPEMRGDSVVWYGYTTDISARKRQEMEIRDLAFFDTLTRLPNRRMFLDRMVEATAACDRLGTHGALLFIDLDNFKTLNDTQGHEVGDAFLVEVSKRLKTCVGERDLVARIGGDEFVMVLESVADSGGALYRAITAANRALGELRKEYFLGELRHLASASIGIVVFDGSEKRADEILKRADMAMYQAKGSGRNRAALFDPATMDRETARYALLGQLRGAFEREELALHFQPQVDDEGVVCGAEVLVRWNHPVRGEIAPDDFIPFAEQFGMGPDLAAYVFERGLRTLAHWQTMTLTAGLRLSVNISVNCFASDDFVPMVRRLLAAYAVDASRLTLELTEHVMAKDHERIAVRMRDIKALGIRLSLDDFGTGYSSLAYLKKLPFDELKIDGGFVRDIEATESDRALVKTILAMARTLGLKAVAEHVENVRQEAFLRAFGCDFFQGYLYSRALPGPEFLALLAAGETQVAKPAGVPHLRHG